MPKPKRIEPGERFDVLPHGVRWGDANIEFVMSDPKFGRCLEICTPTERLQVRVTPGGKFRLGFARKPWKAAVFRADAKPVATRED